MLYSPTNFEYKSHSFYFVVPTKLGLIKRISSKKQQNDDEVAHDNKILIESISTLIIDDSILIIYSQGKNVNAINPMNNTNKRIFTCKENNSFIKGIIPLQSFLPNNKLFAMVEEAVTISPKKDAKYSLIIASFSVDEFLLKEKQSYLIDEESFEKEKDARIQIIEINKNKILLVSIKIKNILEFQIFCNETGQITINLARKLSIPENLATLHSICSIPVIRGLNDIYGRIAITFNDVAILKVYILQENKNMFLRYTLQLSYLPGIIHWDPGFSLILIQKPFTKSGDALDMFRWNESTQRLEYIRELDINGETKISCICSINLPSKQEFGQAGIYALDKESNDILMLSFEYD